MLPRSKYCRAGFTRWTSPGKAYVRRSGTFCGWRNTCFVLDKGKSMRIASELEVHQSFVTEAATTLLRQLGPAAVSYCDRALASGVKQEHSQLLLALRAAMLRAAAATGSKPECICIH
jgi:hypothetical protein